MCNLKIGILLSRNQLLMLAFYSDNVARNFAHSCMYIPIFGLFFYFSICKFYTHKKNNNCRCSFRCYLFTRGKYVNTIRVGSEEGGLEWMGVTNKLNFVYCIIFLNQICTKQNKEPCKKVKFYPIK